MLSNLYEEIRRGIPFCPLKYIQLGPLPFSEAYPLLETSEESTGFLPLMFRVVLKDRPAAILFIKVRSYIGTRKAASDRRWDYTFDAIDEIPNAAHAMVAPCNREKYLEQYATFMMV